MSTWSSDGMARRLATAISSNQREHQMFMAVRRQETAEPRIDVGPLAEAPAAATSGEERSAAPAVATGGAWT